MATLREKKPRVWEVRVFTGTSARGRPTQISRTVRGGKRDAQRLAASLEVGPGSASAAGGKVVDVLDAWIDQNLDTWAPSSTRDQQSRVRSIKQDKIADVERWHTGLRRAGMQDAGFRNQHDQRSEPSRPHAGPPERGRGPTTIKDGGERPPIQRASALTFSTKADDTPANRAPRLAHRQEDPTAPASFSDALEGLGDRED